jgi:hypothetical protein
MSEFGEGERDRKLAAQEQSEQSAGPKGIPFTSLTESQTGNRERGKGGPHSPEVYLEAVLKLLSQCFQWHICFKSDSQCETDLELKAP